MENNTLTISVHLVNDSSIYLFSEESPDEVISKYLYPDSGAPVQVYCIEGKTNDGKEFSLNITNSQVNLTIK